MATTAASYRTPQTFPTTTAFAQASALTRDLDALVAEGVLEEFVDGQGVTRYRPIELAKAA